MAKRLENNQKEKWYKKLRHKYRLVILRDESFEERLSFRLTRMNVFILTGLVSIILIFFTSIIIAFTPLREYIPGYMDINLAKNIYELQRKADSLEMIVSSNHWYISNIRQVLKGEISADSARNKSTATLDYDTITMRRSAADSQLRKEFEHHDQYRLYYYEDGEYFKNAAESSEYLFYPPIRGIVTSKFDLREGHLGIDIVAKQNESVKSVLDGTVLFVGWTVENGNVIIVQHQKNFVSVYKHNSVLLKQNGDFIKAGDPIAIIGETGNLSSGPHLHFELWYNGTPVDPETYMTF